MISERMLMMVEDVVEECENVVNDGEEEERKVEVSCSQPPSYTEES